MEGKDRMGEWGADMHGEYIISLKYSDKVLCDTEAVSGDASMARS